MTNFIGSATTGASPISRYLALIALAGCAARPAAEVHVQPLAGHFQNAYVTRDLDASLAMLAARYGLRDVMRVQPELAVTTPRGPGTMRLDVALLWVGGYQIEVIEPVSGDIDAYRDLLPAAADGSLRFHHIGMRVDDFDAVRAEIARSGRVVAFEGAQPGIQFAYVDARDTLGHFLEYVSLSPDAWKAMGGR